MCCHHSARHLGRCALFWYSWIHLQNFVGCVSRWDDVFNIEVKWKHILLLVMFWTILTVKATTPANIEGYCPTEDWVRWGSHCYSFVNRNEDIRSWASAQTWCSSLAGSRGFNGSVVSIHSEAENRFIYNWIIDSGRTNNDVWIGIKQDTGESGWIIWSSLLNSLLIKYAKYNMRCHHQ